MIAKGIRIETLEDLVNMSNMESAAPTGADSHAAAGSTSEAKVSSRIDRASVTKLQLNM